MENAEREALASSKILDALHVVRMHVLQPSQAQVLLRRAAGEVIPAQAKISA
jgi:hypothetical protein